MNRRSILVAALALAIVGGFVIYQATALAAEPEAKAEIGKAAPNFTLKDVYGKSFSLSDFKDKIVVLEWVNQQCPVSHRTHEQMIMQKTYAAFADKGVVWLGIDTTHTAKPENNRVYQAKQSLAYPILHDPDGKVGRMYGARTTPHMYVIDKKGVLVYDGAIDDDPSGKAEKKTNYVAEALKAVLADKSVSTAETKPYGCSVKYAPAGEKRGGS